MRERVFHKYALKPDGVDSLVVGGVCFVGFDEKYLGGNSPKGESKARRIIRYIMENGGKALYSTDIFNALKEFGVKKPNIMSVVRRYDKRGVVFIRGFRTEKSQTAFTSGFLITRIDPELPRAKAIEEAFQRTVGSR